MPPSNPTVSDVHEPRGRSREATERLILCAARETLAEEGFQGFGVNAVARRAGCDKQLIYRYFGGLDGLVDAIGAELADWAVRTITPPVGHGQAQAPQSYGELVERLMLGLMQSLRGDRLVQKIAAWELSAPSAQVHRLAQARSASLQAWIVAERGELKPPAGRDAPALNALLIAAVQHMVLSAAAAGGFGGVALTTEADWDRIAAALSNLIRTVYA